MKTHLRRFGCCALAVLLLIMALPAGSAAVSVTFVAVNDNLMELGAYTPVTSGVVYVPGALFSEGLGIVFSNNPNAHMASLYTSTSTLVFDLNEAAVYDTQGTSYSVSALQRDGRVYLPLDFVCNYFSLSYSWNTVEFGSLLRIKNASAELTDYVFISAASSLMQKRYNAYVASLEPSVPATDPDVTVPVTPSGPNEPDEPEHYSARLFICGALDESTAAVLDTLASSGAKATFFTDAESIAANGDLVRRIYCSGHAIGALGGETAAPLNEALDAVLMTKTRLVCSEKSEALDAAGYAVVQANLSTGSDKTDAEIASLLRALAAAETVNIAIPAGADAAAQAGYFISYMGAYCTWLPCTELAVK